MTDAPTEREDEGAWTKLRRRKVVQWGIAYAAGAWALLQGIGFVADAFAWPSASKQIATLVLLFGIPIALVIAWYHGDRGHSGTKTRCCSCSRQLRGRICNECLKSASSSQKANSTARQERPVASSLPPVNLRFANQVLSRLDFSPAPLFRSARNRVHTRRACLLVAALSRDCVPVDQHVQVRLDDQGQDIGGRQGQAGLFVHAITFRNESRYLARSYLDDPQAEYRQFFRLGVDGVFSEFPDTAIAAR